MEPGTKVIYDYRPPKGWGRHFSILATVVKIRPKKVQIEIQKRVGAELKWVKREKLSEIRVSQ
jgi:hypothetical protein